MKSLSPGLAAYLAGGVTTLCRCWRVERKADLVTDLPAVTTMGELIGSLPVQANGWDQQVMYEEIDLVEVEERRQSPPALMRLLNAERLLPGPGFTFPKP